MRKRIFWLAVLGFLLGVAANYLVPAAINHVPIGSGTYSEQLLARVGSPGAAALLTFLVLGLFGSVCMLGTLFYEIERWPLALATAAHYLTISLGYLIPCRVLGWDLPLRLLLRIEGVMTLGFVLIWLIMYLSYRRQVRELNELRRRMQPAPEAENENEEIGKERP